MLYITGRIFRFWLAMKGACADGMNFASPLDDCPDSGARIYESCTNVYHLMWLIEKAMNDDSIFDSYPSLRSTNDPGCCNEIRSRYPWSVIGPVILQEANDALQAIQGTGIFTTHLQMRSY